MIDLILLILLSFCIGVCIGYIGGIKRCDEFMQEVLNIINSDETDGD